MKKIVNQPDDEEQARALEFMGKPYVKMPRLPFNLLTSDDPNKRNVGLMYIAIFGSCYYSDGYVMRNKQELFCHRGEFICSQRELAHIMQMHRNTIRTTLQYMVNLGLVVYDRITNGIRIRVIGYEQLAAPEISAQKEDKKNPQKTASPFDTMHTAEEKLGRSMQQDELKEKKKDSKKDDDNKTKPHE